MYWKVVGGEGLRRKDDTGISGTNNSHVQSENCQK